MASTFTDKEKATVKTLHAANHSAAYIGDFLHRTPKSVRKCERELGLAKRKSIPNKDTLAVAAKKRAATVEREKLLHDGWPKPTTTPAQAYGTWQYGRPKAESKALPISGRRLSIAARQVSMGCSAAMCAESL